MHVLFQRPRFHRAMIAASALLVVVVQSCRT